MAWITSDLSKSGIMGDAPAGTAEKGREWVDLNAKAMAEYIAEVGRSGRRALSV